MRFTIRHLRRVTSTNTLMRQSAEQGAPEGLVISADYQTRGRGRPGRKWISPTGRNLLFSVLLRPPIPPSRAPLLTQIACRSVARVLKDRYGIQSQFKKPNDLIVRGRKICGVLVEASSGSNGKLHYAVVGIGLNVNSPPEDLLPTATSMAEVRGRKFHRRKVLNLILRELLPPLRELYAHPS